VGPRWDAVTPSGGSPIGVYVKNTKPVNNAFGIRSLGPNVTVRVDGSGVIGNSTGLSFSRWWRGAHSREQHGPS
jgi:hypothetical protein